MDAVKISITGLIFTFALLAVPLLINHLYRLKMAKDTIWSIGRMSIQLFLVGIFLEYIFALNNVWLNLAWLALMITTAVFSAVNTSKVQFKIIFIPVLISFTVPTLLILFYFNAFVIRLDYLFDARYLIAIGGMLLGNVLGVSIVAVNSFYQDIKSQQKLFLYRLAMSANKKEALTPFIRDSFQLSLLPTLAKTATIGVVSLPGMMTGQILGGSSPATAIRYQIAIMIAIYVTSILSVLLTLLISAKNSFNHYGVMKEGVYKRG